MPKGPRYQFNGYIPQTLLGHYSSLGGYLIHQSSTQNEVVDENLNLLPIIQISFHGDSRISNAIQFLLILEFLQLKWKKFEALPGCHIRHQLVACSRLQQLNEVEEINMIPLVSTSFCNNTKGLLNKARPTGSNSHQ